MILCDFETKKTILHGDLLTLLSEFSYLTYSIKKILNESGVNKTDAQTMIQEAFNLGIHPVLEHIRKV